MLKIEEGKMDFIHLLRRSLVLALQRTMPNLDLCLLEYLTCGSTMAIVALRKGPFVQVMKPLQMHILVMYSFSLCMEINQKK